MSRSGLTLQRPKKPVRSEPTVQEIIAGARSAQSSQRELAPARGALLLSLGTGLLLWASYMPLNCSPLAWLAPVPLLLLARLQQPTRRMLWSAYLGGALFYLPALQWMRLGDPLMYLAWWALALYLAAYFPLTAALCRLAVQRWSIPLVVAAPVVWVGLEYAKAHLLTGFAWYFLGHTQYRWLELIQLSDVVGAYGVSFVMALSAAALAALVPVSWFRRLRLLPPAAQAAAPLSPEGNAGVTPARAWPVGVAVAVFAAALTYGYVRRGQADFQPGPRVALIQGNFLASLRIQEQDYEPTYLTHAKLTGLAVREQPDVIIWPESMFRWPLLSAPADLSSDELQRRAPMVPPGLWRDESVRQTLTHESGRAQAAMIFGIECVDLTDAGLRQANSALLSLPETGLAGRYDKLHLVPFGEYMPFVKSCPWLQQFSPYPEGFGLEPGRTAAVFAYKSWRMTPVICFEDTVPHLVRRIISVGSEGETGRPVDVIVNLSNDGWFHGSSGLDQHLITAAFRAVECRTPLVRAVNTGISAVIDGDGAILDPEVFIDGDRKGRTSSRDPKTGRWHKQLNAAIVHTVPLDGRTSPYVRYGDWFAGLCCAATLLLLLSRWLPQSALARASAPGGIPASAT